MVTWSSESKAKEKVKEGCNMETCSPTTKVKVNKGCNMETWSPTTKVKVSKEGCNMETCSPTAKAKVERGCNMETCSPEVSVAILAQTKSNSQNGCNMGTCSPKLQVAVPGVSHGLFNHPKDKDCDICDQSRLKEAPAKKAKKNSTEKVEANKFGDLVHIDTLFLNEGSDGKLEQSESWTKIQLQVFKDTFSDDIEAFQTSQRDWRTIRDCIIEFGGKRDAIDRVYSDRAKEIRKACKELCIAPLRTTPGRSTSHAVAESANRVCLEWGRHGLLQGGGSIEWAGRAIKHELMHRRLQPRENGSCIYDDRHGAETKKPKLWPFMAKVFFKSPMLKGKVAKIAPPGVEGLLVGYEVQPGGKWTGDHQVISLKDFDEGHKTARISTTKSVTFPKHGDETQAEFPLAEARKLIALRKRADYIEQKEKFKVDVAPIAEEDEDADDQDFDEEGPKLEEEEDDFGGFFRLNATFRRRKWQY